MWMICIKMEVGVGVIFLLLLQPPGARSCAVHVKSTNMSRWQHMNRLSANNSHLEIDRIGKTKSQGTKFLCEDGVNCKLNVPNSKSY